MIRRHQGLSFSAFSCLIDCKDLPHENNAEFNCPIRLLYIMPVLKFMYALTILLHCKSTCSPRSISKLMVCVGPFNGIKHVHLEIQKCKILILSSIHVWSFGCDMKFKKYSSRMMICIIISTCSRFSTCPLCEQDFFEHSFIGNSDDTNLNTRCSYNFHKSSQNMSKDGCDEQ